MVRPREGIEHRFIREYEITNFLRAVEGVINVFDIGEEYTIQWNYASRIFQN